MLKVVMVMLTGMRRGRKLERARSDLRATTEFLFWLNRGVWPFDCGAARRGGREGRHRSSEPRRCRADRNVKPRKRGEAEAAVVDVRKPSDVQALQERMQARFGLADFIVNNAGWTPTECLYQQKLTNLVPAIRQAAVVGLPDKRLGEVPVAYVVLHEGQAALGESIVAACRGRIASFKIPRRVVFVSELPQTASGKMRRFLVKKRAIDELLG